MKRPRLPIAATGGDRQPLPEMPASDHAFRDELNLAEFPIAALTDRVPAGQTTLVFEDHITQPDGTPIVRRLTVMAHPKRGLPVAIDDEVMVGLIQLTKRRNNFTDQKVWFSRYELIELLGWPHDGRSYSRIEEALDRWVGAVLTYENAWWDNQARSWVDESFHILDNVSLYDRERRRRAGGGKPAAAGKGSGPVGDPQPLSSFRWNEVIFRSFQAGNLKQLDLEFYLHLKLPTTKRLFRFLDKRFYRRNRLEFDLTTMAFEHIGMSRAYSSSELKRRLRPALEELERLGFLEPLGTEERYVNEGRGRWRILLIRGPRGRAEAAPAAADAEAGVDALAEALVARGVTPRTAAELVAEAAPERLRTKIEVFDWLAKSRDKRVAKNPAGYLVASIRADYRPPEGFAPVPPRPAPGSAAEPPPESPAARRRRERAEQAQARAREAESRARWEALAEPDRELITAAVRAENPGLRRWKAMLEPLCLADLDRRLASGWRPAPAPPRPVQAPLFPDADPTD